MSDLPPPAPARVPTNEDFEDLYEHAPCGYLSIAPDGRIVLVNQTLCDWTGLEKRELIGSRFRDRLNMAGRIYMETHLRPLLLMQGFANEVALDLELGDGKRLPILVNAVQRKDAAGNLLFTRMTVFNAVDRRRYERELLSARMAADHANTALQSLNDSLEQRVSEVIAQRMTLEDSLRQSQKMEAVGQLTGGIAHDFNNLLAGIGGSIELLGIRLKQGRTESLTRYIDAAAGAVTRAASLTHRLLAFSRQQKLEPKAVDVHRLVLDMEELIRRTVGPAVTLEVVGPAGLWPVLIDPNQLENAILNLCINARDAMPDGGLLTIEAANTPLDERSVRSHVPPGHYVTLSVRDTGTGMTPEVIARAFEPFFTTKDVGSGTGLGLSMVFGFARQSCGEVQIDSQPGRGTRMAIILPRHHGKLNVEVPTSFVLGPRPNAGHLTVLVVDDEPTVRLLVSEVLTECGYQSLEAADGPGALRILHSDLPIDLLITDLGLPGGLSGRQLADAARAHRPQLKTLFITGFADNATPGGSFVDATAPVLTKPFSVEALVAKLAELLPA